ncbi:MAG: aat [Frankiales bacterium]|nr:aat [Frankiales bacterium]
MDPEAFFEGLDVVGARRELVALGGTLEPDTLRAAYRAGCFPWPASGDDEQALERQVQRLARRAAVPVLPGDDGLVPWCSPHPRAVLLTDAVAVPRTVRQLLRRCGWTTTLDVAFADVVAGCAARDETWINARMREAYTQLHARGVAHSVEVWDGETLVGGLYGVLTGQVFSGESMFHRVSGASKVALVDLCVRLREVGVLVLDTQQESEHLAALGQVLVARQEYVEAVHALRDTAVVLPDGRRRAAELLPTGVSPPATR